MLAPDTFAGHTAVVTGAGGAIGRAACQSFARHGARVVAVDRSAAALDATAHTLSAMGSEILAICADVTSSREVAGYVEKTLAAFGSIDAFFNNAGFEGVVAPLAEYEEEDFDRVLAVNVKGVFLGLRHVLPVMIGQKSGAVVNTGSLASERGLPGTGAYNASKHAVAGLTRTAATEVGVHGVRVNAVLPGMIDSRMLRSLAADLSDGAVEQTLDLMGSVSPLGRLGKPDEVASVVTLLSSPATAFVTGACYAVDGGALAGMANGS
jgi:NAD(P)-dependent dehydrogenase (short-subunit alcohol dehydrogenase family)